MHLDPLPERSNFSGADVAWLNKLRDTVNVLVADARIDESSWRSHFDDVCLMREDAAEAAKLTPNAVAAPVDMSPASESQVEQTLIRLLRRAGISLPADGALDAPTQPPPEGVALDATTTPVPVGGDRPSNVDAPKA